MIFPEYLSQNDTVALVAPARKISYEEILPTIEWLTKAGFKVELGENILSEYHQFAGTDTQRCADIQYFLDAPHIKAILCARGGYGSVRLIDRLDFSKFLQHPKWFCGYSDITVFHTHLNRLACASIHSTMCINITAETLNNENSQSLLRALRGETLSYSFAPSELNKTGCATGELVGGNLSILYSLLASPSDLITDGKILFIEDLDEYLYHIDRMMMAMKRAGKLAHLAGLVVGGMSQMNDNTIPYGKTAIEIVAEHCQEYKFPVAFNFPAGHIDQNMAIKLGSIVQLQVTTQNSQLIFK